MARLGMLARTKGMQAAVDFGEGTVGHFVAGGHKRFVIAPPDPMMGAPVAVNGQIETADGTRYYAILQIDESSNGEHAGTIVFTPSGLAVQGEENFCRVLDKPEAKVFPYRYRYAVALCCSDHYVGLDGWSWKCGVTR